MLKGKFGISITVIAAVIFGFVLLKQPQSVLLIVGFALLAEKDEWLNKQAMQALFLTITYYLAVVVLDLVLGNLSRVFMLLDLYRASALMAGFNSFLGIVLNIVLVLFAVIAISRVLKGRDAGLPFISKVVDQGLPTPRPTHVPPVQQAYAPPVQTQETVQESVCSNCSAHLEKDARFCNECGTKV